MNNSFFQFIATLITRLFSTKPKFFQTIQWLSFLTGGVSSAILYLQSLNIELPSWVNSLGSVNVVIISVVTLIMAQLPNNKE